MKIKNQFIQQEVKFNFLLTIFSFFFFAVLQ